METGSQADARRLNVLLRPDGTVIVPPRLAPWIKALAQADITRRRREAGLAYDVLLLLDALSLAPEDVAVSGNDVPSINRLGVGDVPSHVGEAASTREAAEELGYSVRTVRWMLTHGRLTGVKLGRDWHVSRASINEFLYGKAV